MLLLFKFLFFLTNFNLLLGANLLIKTKDKLVLIDCYSKNVYEKISLLIEPKSNLYYESSYSLNITKSFVCNSFEEDSKITCKFSSQNSTYIIKEKLGKDIKEVCWPNKNDYVKWLISVIGAIFLFLILDIALIFCCLICKDRNTKEKKTKRQSVPKKTRPTLTKIAGSTVSFESVDTSPEGSGSGVITDNRKLIRSKINRSCNIRKSSAIDWNPIMAYGEFQFKAKGAGVYDNKKQRNHKKIVKRRRSSLPSLFRRNIRPPPSLEELEKPSSTKRNEIFEALSANTLMDTSSVYTDLDAVYHNSTEDESWSKTLPPRLATHENIIHIPEDWVAEVHMRKKMRCEICGEEINTENPSSTCLNCLPPPLPLKWSESFEESVA